MSTLEKLREQLDHETRELEKIEDALHYQNQRLGKLNGGYLSVIRQIIQIHERNLFPLISCRHMLEDQIDFITTRMEWEVVKVRQIDKVPAISEGGLELALTPCASGALNDAVVALKKAYERFDAECSPSNLYVLMNTSAPSDVALETLRLVSHLLGDEEDTWEATRVLLTSNYFLEFFRRRSDFLMKYRDALSPSLMLEIDLFCRDVNHSQYVLYDENVCLGVLGEWIRAIWNYYRCLYITAPIFLQDKSPANITEIKDTLNTVTYREFPHLPIPPPLLCGTKESERQSISWGAPPSDSRKQSKQTMQSSEIPLEGTDAVSMSSRGSTVSEESKLYPSARQEKKVSNAYLEDSSSEAPNRNEKQYDERNQVPREYEEEISGEYPDEPVTSRRSEIVEVPDKSLTPAPPSSIFHEMVRRLNNPEIICASTGEALEELKALLEWKEHLEYCAQEVEREIEKEEVLITTEIRQTQEGYDEDMLPIQEEFEALVRDFVEQYADTRATGRKFYWFLNEEQGREKTERRKHSMLSETSG